MTTYIAQENKKGKTIYYRVEDGKKKSISRAEYEKNQENVIIPEQETETVYNTNSENVIIPEEEIQVKTVVCETEPNERQEILTSTLGIVQSVMESLETIPKYDLSTQQINSYTLIKYRNCAIIALITNQKNEVAELCFMGTTAQKRNRLKKYKFSGMDDIIKRTEEIREQFEFIDEWQSKKNIIIESA